MDRIQQGLHLVRDGSTLVGQGLLDVRNAQTYKDTHKTFEAWVTDTFGLTRGWAYSKIKHYESTMRLESHNLPADIAKTESHVDVLNDVPDDKLTEVVDAARERAASKGKKMSAADLKAAVKEVDSVVEDGDEDEVETTVEPATKEKSYIEMAMENAPQLDTLVRAVRAIGKQIDAVPSGPGTDDFCNRRQSIKMYLEQLIGSMQVGIPHSICPHCEGEKCPQCGNLGWVNSSLAREFAKGETTETVDF